MSEVGTSNPIRTFVNFIKIVAVIGLLAIAYNTYRSWTQSDDEGRIPVSAYLVYSPPERVVMASWKLGYEVNNHPIDHSPFSTAGAANVGAVIFFVAVPVTGVTDMTVTLYVRGKPVKTCDRVMVENSTCTWTVA